MKKRVQSLAWTVYRTPLEARNFLNFDFIILLIFAMKEEDLSFVKQNEGNEVA